MAHSDQVRTWSDATAQAGYAMMMMMMNFTEINDRLMINFD